MKFLISDNIKKCYPTAEECKVNNSVACTEEGCSSVFKSESNLNLHLVKTHNKSNLSAADSFIKQYFCPELGCNYNSEKYFKELKVLRTHYMMKHGTEKFICVTCQKMFSLQKSFDRHIEYCNVDFTCPTCQVSYPLYETLQTHARRKKHIIPHKSHFKLNRKRSEPILNISNKTPILPKTSYSFILLPTNGITINQGTQVSKYKSKMTQVCPEFRLKNKPTTVETQTIGDYIPVKKINSGDNLNQKTSNTQTDVIESKNSSSNTNFKEDYSMKDVGDVTNSSTQTVTNNSPNTHYSIYTDTSDLLQESLNMSGFEFDNCHTETQTDFLFDDMFECDFMSNMYTQTCDQILNDLGFSNIQTQTTIDDMLKSVESQTVMSRKKTELVDKDMMHMETQTDMEFKEMLEVINS